MANFTVFEGGVTSTSKQLPDIDVRYGPYRDIPHAMEVLGEDDLDVITEGLTVGIWVNNKIVEYWFQGGTDSDHLVPKQTSKMVWE